VPQAEWRRRRQQWSQHGRDVASVREDPTDHPPPPTRLNRSVDFELGGPSAGQHASVDDSSPRTATADATTTHRGGSRSLLGRGAATLSCRVLLLDGDEITIQVEVNKKAQLSLGKTRYSL